MNTAIAITAIIAARDVAKAKHQPTTCRNCGQNTSKENQG